MIQIMIHQVLHDMSSILDSSQMERLKSVLDNTFKNVRLQKNEDNSMDNITL